MTAATQTISSTGLNSLTDKSTASTDINESRLAQLQAAFELSACPTIILSLENLQFVAVNEAASSFLQLEDGGHGNLKQFVLERDRAQLAELHRAWKQGSEEQCALFVSARDGNRILRWKLQRVAESIVAVADAAGPRESPTSLQDLDPLTGQMNRRVLEHRIERALDRKDHCWGVLFIDLNNYKRVNDQRGHIEGDRVLAEFARRLAASVRPGDLVARYGGDEFVVLVEQIPTAIELRSMANRIMSEVRMAIEGSRPEIVVSASIGCAMASNELSTTAAIIGRADRDMYQMKRRHPN